MTLILLAISLTIAACVIAWNLAIYALPVMVAITAAQYAWGAGAGVVMSGLIAIGAAVLSIALVIVLSVLLFIVFTEGREEDTGIVLLFYCVTVVPLVGLRVAVYISARALEDRLIADEREEVED